MKRVKSIPEIYSEAKRFDCVLTTDAALARGLNRLIDTPRFGIFAVTPRQLAEKYSYLHFPKIFSKFEFITLVSKETGKLFRIAHALTENILSVWNQSGMLELTEIHLTEEAKTLLPLFEKYPMLEYAVQSFDESFFEGKTIAVIGKEFFNELDLQALPKQSFYEEIKIFTDEKFSLKKTYSFGNTKTLIDNVMQLVTKENMNHTAIVLEPNSDYNILLQTRLKEEGVSVQVKSTHNENLTVRFMLGLIENSIEYDSLFAKDLKEAGKLFGFEINPQMENFNLDIYVNSSPDKLLKAFFKLMTEAEKHSFKDFTNELIEKFECDELNIFSILLEKINFANEKISEENLIELKYILENFDVELSQKKNGVLFVDAKNSAFINRDVIFYPGLDESWFASTSEKQYIDKEKEDEKNLKKFEVLLQQGSERLYFVQVVKDNEEVLPAPYFSILENRPVTSFKDEVFNPVLITGDNSDEKTEDNIISLEEAEEISSIAPTSLKKFVLCPAKYFYDTVTPQKEAPYFLKGNLIHQFGEFYFQHPEFCRDNLNKIMTYILKEYSSMISKTEIEIERTNFEIALNNVMSFLDTSPVEKIPLRQKEEKSKNTMMKYFGKEKVFDYSEKTLSDKYFVKGIADLRDKKTIVDYKSGANRYKLKDLPKLIDINYILKEECDDFDFQAVSYLAALKNENPDEEKIKFIYNYVLANRKNILDERLRSEDNLTQFSYIDLDFIQYLQTENCYLFVKENIKPELRRYIDYLDFSGYKKIFEDDDINTLDFFDKVSVVNTLSSKLIKAHQQAKLSFRDFNKKLVKTYQEDLYKLTEIFYNIRSNHGVIFKDDVKKFVDFVKEKLTEINSYKKNNFPALPLYESNLICKDCDYLNICRGNLLWN